MRLESLSCFFLKRSLSYVCRFLLQRLLVLILNFVLKLKTLDEEETKLILELLFNLRRVRLLNDSQDFIWKIKHLWSKIQVFMIFFTMIYFYFIFFSFHWTIFFPLINYSLHNFTPKNKLKVRKRFDQDEKRKTL